MADKKNIGRFCIQFNTEDIHHMQVINILNGQGRHKAAFVANAILHYINCGDNPIFHQDNEILKKTIEIMVKDILLNQDSQNHKVKQPINKKHKSSNLDLNAIAGDMDDESLLAMKDSINSFRSPQSES